MPEDSYAEFAERYDWMVQANPVRREFFQRLFAEHHVARVLDCACGTGRDLLMFHSLGLEVFGSDLSDSMLAQARKHVGETGVPIQKADFCELPAHYHMAFDAVACLTNSINELLDDAGTLRALHSMKSVLRTGGLLVFDQGQSDASMQAPPRFAPVVNNREFTRCFVMDYVGNLQTVHICDFIHTEATSDFKQATIQIRIRLLDSWRQILRDVGFAEVQFFGNWDASPYDKESSRRLIAVAKK